mmetsp:Transcript_9163/g.21668  ORF Transcript_9163/g.21668 Transcript_9163/m.21668 type:complete len:217 (+) Transcript_9163:150-800(+)
MDVPVRVSRVFAIAPSGNGCRCFLPSIVISQLEVVHGVAPMGICACFSDFARAQESGLVDVPPLFVIYLCAAVLEVLRDKSVGADGYELQSWKDCGCDLFHTWHVALQVGDRLHRHGHSCRDLVQHTLGSHVTNLDTTVVRSLHPVTDVDVVADLDQLVCHDRGAVRCPASPAAAFVNLLVDQCKPPASPKRVRVVEESLIVRHIRLQLVEPGRIY